MCLFNYCQTLLGFFLALLSIHPFDLCNLSINLVNMWNRHSRHVRLFIARFALTFCHIALIFFYLFHFALIINLHGHCWLRLFPVYSCLPSDSFLLLFLKHKSCRLFQEIMKGKLVIVFTRRPLLLFFLFLFVLNSLGFCELFLLSLLLWNQLLLCKTLRMVLLSLPNQSLDRDNDYDWCVHYENKSCEHYCRSSNEFFDFMSWKHVDE